MSIHESFCSGSYRRVRGSDSYRRVWVLLGVILTHIEGFESYKRV